MTTYSISLDDVDLALLPQRSRIYNDFLKKEHYQFQVMKTDIVKEPEPTILYTCHICAIQVPAAFAREHTASIKHRANARIASVAAERTRALITAHPPPTCAQPTARFCANCTTIVGRNHEKTKEHRVAVMHDKLLWELMTAYVDNDENDDDENYDSDYSEPEYISSELGNNKETGSQNCNGFGTWDKVNGNEGKQKCDRTVPLKTIKAKKRIDKNEEKEDNQCKVDKDNNVDNKTKLREKPAKIESSNGEKTKITTNGQDSPARKNEPKTDNMESSNGEKTEITTNGQDSPARKNAPKTVNIESSNGEKTENTTNGQDSPARKNEPKTDNIESSNGEKTEITTNGQDSSARKNGPKTDNIESSNGVKTKISTNGQDSSARKNEPKTDNIESSNGEKTEITTNGQDSPARKTEPITKNEEIATSIEPKVTNYQDSKETKSIINVDTTSNKPKAQDNNKIEYIEFVTKDNKQVKVLSDHYHSFTRKEETINCIICSITFKNDDVDSHVFSWKHLNKIPSTLIDEHCGRPINDTYSHCILCNQMIKTSNLARHYVTFGHGMRERQTVTDTNQATTSKIGKIVNTDVGKPVNLDVKAKTANVNGYVAPIIPEKAKNAPNEAKTSIDWPVIYPFEVTRQETTVRCIICDCQVPSNPENRKEHLAGGNHANNVKNKRNLCPYVATNKGVARCVICDVKVTVSPENFREHLTGSNHAKNVLIRKDALRASTSKATLLTKTTQQTSPGANTLASTYEKIRAMYKLRQRAKKN